MKWEAQSVEEMGKKYYPLMGPGGGDELPLRDGGGHPSTSRSGHDWRKIEVGSEDLGAGARVRRDG